MKGLIGNKRSGAGILPASGRDARPTAATPFLVVAALGLAVAAAPVRAQDKVPAFPEVRRIITARCLSCHADTPAQMEYTEAPGAIKFDTPAEIQAYAKAIAATAVDSKKEPPSNATDMTDQERQTLGAWIKAGAKLN